MSNLSKSIENVVNKSINNFIEKISDNYKIDEKELLKLWEELENTKIKSRKNSVATTKKGCCYIFTKGAKQGLTCDAKCTDENTVSGKSYCKNHYGKNQIIVRTHPILKKFYHPPSDLVFKSKKEKIIIGRIFNGAICPLTDDDIKTCKSFKFRYERLPIENTIE